METFTTWLKNSGIKFDLDVELFKNNESTLRGFFDIAKLKLSVKIKNVVLNNCSSYMVTEEALNSALNNCSVRDAINEYGFMFGIDKRDVKPIAQMFKKKLMIGETDHITSSDQLILVLSAAAVDEMIMNSAF